MPGNGGGLTIRLLGGVAVERGGVPLDLPRSRKTRALLAYLALNGRPSTRQRLCALLWEVPDDPRAALRWSLSRLRAVVGDAADVRLITDRQTVGLEASADALDVHRLQQAVRDPDAVPEDERMALATAGGLLDGLTLPDCHDFEAWLAAERQTVREARVSVLRHLVSAQGGDPDKAVQTARALCDVNPLDGDDRAGFVRLLYRSGRADEAARQIELARALFKAEAVPTAAVDKVAGEIGRPVGMPAMATDAPAAPETVKPETPEARVIDPRPSVAVLPFFCRDEASADGAVGDAIAQDIITQLSLSRSLFVIARGSTFQLRGREADVGAVETRLSARYALSGAVERDGTRLRVTVELSDVPTGTICWSDKIDCVADDIFEARDHIARNVAVAVGIEVLAAEIRRALKFDPAEMDAWTAFHRGLWHAYRANREDNDIAHGLFARSVALDPSFARGYAGLSITHFQRVFARYSDRPAEEAEQALATARQSLRLNASDPVGHYVFGRALLLGGETAGAVASIEHSVQIDPNFAPGHYSLGFAKCQFGDPQESIDHTELAKGLSPIDPTRFAMLATQAISLFRLSDFEPAADLAMQASRLHPDYVQTQAIAAIACHRAGRMEDRDTALGHIHRILPGYRWDHFITGYTNLTPDVEKMFRSALSEIGID